MGTTSHGLESLKQASWLVKLAKPKHAKNSTKWILTKDATAVEHMHEQYFNPNSLLGDRVCYNTTDHSFVERVY